MQIRADELERALRAAAEGFTSIDATPYPGHIDISGPIDLNRAAELLSEHLNGMVAGTHTPLRSRPPEISAGGRMVSDGSGALNEAGRCRICGCTDDQACTDAHPHRTCGWADPTHTLCDNPDCLAAADQAQAA